MEASTINLRRVVATVEVLGYYATQTFIPRELCAVTKFGKIHIFYQMDTSRYVQDELDSMIAYAEHAHGLPLWSQSNPKPVQCFEDDLQAIWELTNENRAMAAIATSSAIILEPYFQWLGIPFIDMNVGVEKISHYGHLADVTSGEWQCSEHRMPGASTRLCAERIATQVDEWVKRNTGYDETGIHMSAQILFDMHGLKLQ
ncbi:hypothetical protein HDE_03675 [Halotydeus destructor]|nr:hypothetical protein HDE_03675 [Halotydeus destructor]